jgi:hypothetical protein
MKGKELNETLESFLRHIDSIKDTLPTTLFLLEPYRRKANTKFEEFLSKNTAEVEEEEGGRTVSIKLEMVKIFEQLSKNAEISNLAIFIIHESLFVSLISQYDSFLNRLLRVMYNIRPEYINNSERQLTFSQLNEFPSIDEAREYIIEKEVETILRKNHSEHFDYLENKLGIKLKKDLPIWKKFIELTERRNLLVHCNGQVSNQYLKVCKEHDCDTDGIKINEKLEISMEYFVQSYECLYELSTKLVHTIWRKLRSDDLEEADKELNSLCYSLLISRQYNLADILLEFGYKQVKHYNDASKNLFIVNKSLSQYLQNHRDNAANIINSKDWSATSDNFKLAHLILNEKFNETYILMRRIGDDGDVLKDHYKTWPLFYKLRDIDGFKNTFKEIFNEEYSVLEIPKRPVQEILEEFHAQNNERENQKKDEEGNIETKKVVRKKTRSKLPND